jgi:hypothetical protein
MSEDLKTTGEKELYTTEKMLEFLEPNKINTVNTPFMEVEDLYIVNEI